jgi:hypothetical protein
VTPTELQKEPDPSKPLKNIGHGDFRQEYRKSAGPDSAYPVRSCTII